MARTKKAPPLSKEAALAAIRGIMRPTGFDEEEQTGDEILFGSREGGDMEEDRHDPALARFALATAKKIEAAVPGSKARVDTVDEWVSIGVTIPASKPWKRAKGPEIKPPAPAPVPSPVQMPAARRGRLQPGAEIKYTNFTVGGSQQGTAIVTWDHGKRVEARTLGGQSISLERAADGSLRRFT